MTPNKGHWMSALLLAGLLHAAIAAAWFNRPHDDGAMDAGVGGIQVSVGLAGRYTPTPQPVEPAPEETANDEVQVEPAEQETPVEPTPETEPATEVVQQTEPEPVEKAVDKPIAPKPVVPKKPTRPKQVTKRIAPAKPKSPAPAPTPPIKQQTVADNTTARRPSTQATGTGQQLETGGDPAARQGYYAQVMAQIARHKRYPRSARREGATGVATVTFVIAADGSLQTQLLKRSSGDERLDKEALAMLKRASPFPPIPKAIGDGPLKLTLPIEFSLHR